MEGADRDDPEGRVAHADAVPSDSTRRSSPPLEEPALPAPDPAESPSFEPNRVLRWIYGRFFRHMGVDERWSGVVRESAARGIVVYVMRSISVLDFLCLDYLLKRFRLPLVRFVNDLGLWILEPFGRGERRLRLRPQIPQQEALAKVVQAHESALLFLRRPPSLGERPKGQGLDVDLIRTLVEQQRKLDRPILLVPQTFVWTKRPPSKKPTLVDLLFGPSEWPGRIRVFLRFLLNYRNALLRSGEPFDVGAFLAENQDLTDAQAADRIRYALLRRMEREQQIVLGPATKSAARIRQEILRSPRVRKHVEAAAREQKKPLAVIEQQADKDLRKLCAMMDPNVLALFTRFLAWLWERLFDGMVIDHEGLERLREAARRGPVILLPSHRSHVDYLVLSHVLSRNAVSPPLIAAGDNLSFFPIGGLLRRCGAFFIRRSFKGRKLYTVLVDAYLRRILVEGFNVEFFLEGGRSRTGKLLPPKLGLLTMVVDAGLKLPSVDLSFMPISVGYDRIIEEGSYVRELVGGDKRPESVGGLLRSSRVLGSRYGRLYIQFGRVFGLHELVDEAVRLRGDPSADRPGLKPTERRALIQRVAHRVTYEINRVTIVTPAALVASALLSHRRRGMTHADLLHRAAELVAALRRAGARIAAPVLRDDSPLLTHPDSASDLEVARAALNDSAVDETLALFTEGGLIETRHVDGERIHSVPSARRLALEYHKNTILHFFVPSALISAALETAGDEPVEEATLRERVARLSKLFKYEFMYRADASFDEIFEDALRTMLDAGEVERLDGRLRAVPGSPVPIYAGMLRTYFESYRLALRALERVRADGPVKTKDWIKQTLARGNKLYHAGEIELRESLSRPKLESALSAFRDLGLVRLTSETIEPAPGLADDEALPALDRRLSKYLER
jgi:glycerol-3-phosphate O-acyltransferase